MPETNKEIANQKNAFFLRPFIYPKGGRDNGHPDANEGKKEANIK